MTSFFFFFLLKTNVRTDWLSDLGTVKVNISLMFAHNIIFSLSSFYSILSLVCIWYIFLVPQWPPPLPPFPWPQCHLALLLQRLSTPATTCTQSEESGGRRTSATAATRRNGRSCDVAPIGKWIGAATSERSPCCQWAGVWERMKKGVFEKEGLCGKVLFLRLGLEC